MIDHHRLLMYI